MSLQLRVLNPGDCGVIEGETRICNGPAFTIGRGPDNDWVLLDAQRYLSKHHCRIERTDSGYRVVDTSTNGVFVGDAAAPIGRGNARPVADGDILNLGSCIVRIEIGGELAAALALRDTTPQPSLDEPVTHPQGFEPSGGNFAWSSTSAMDSEQAEAPFAPITGFPGFDTAAGGLSSRDAVSLDEPSSNPSMTETFFRAPEVLRPAIPPDWQADPIEPAARIEAEAAASSPTPDTLAAVQVEPAPLRRKAGADIIDMPGNPTRIKTPISPMPPAPMPPSPIAAAPLPAAPIPQTRTPTPAAPVADVDARRLIEAFLDGAALPIEAFDMTDPATTMRKIGQAFREAVGGIRELLESRAMLKAEFRLEHTLVRARDNNPLKFSTNLDGTLAVMLGRRVPGFMEPPEAIRESVRDVKAHEIAIMAGLKAALAGQLEQLAPAQLRAQVEKSGGGGILPHVKKARLWERFEDLHEQMSTEQVAASPVGRHFAEAYSTQYRKI